MVISAGTAYSGIVYGFMFYGQRQRSPDAAPCAAYGATHCWELFCIQIQNNILPFHISFKFLKGHAGLFHLA